MSNNRNKYNPNDVITAVFVAFFIFIGLIIFSSCYRFFSSTITSNNIDNTTNRYKSTSSNYSYNNVNTSNSYTNNVINNTVVNKVETNNVVTNTEGNSSTSKSLSYKSDSYSSSSSYAYTYEDDSDSNYSNKITSSNSSKSSLKSTSTSTSSSSGSGDYVLNTNTRKFHHTLCSSVRKMSDSNKRYSSESRDEIISQGYEPCKRCNP